MEKKKEQKNSSKKDVFNKIKELWKTPRGKAIAFLGFYFLFFVFVISALGSGNSSTTKTPSSSEVDLSLLESYNYHFHYQDILGQSSIIYDGDRNASSSLFTKTVGDSSLEFFSKDSVYLTKDLVNNQYVMVEDPYVFSELKQVDNIKKMLEKATYLSTDSTSQECTKETYQISTTTLVSLFENKEIDLDDMPNTIILTLNSSRQVYKIEYSFNSYSIYKGNGTYQSSMEYSNFSNVGEIENPS